MSYGKKLFWIGFSLVAFLFLIGYVSLISKSDQLANKHARDRETYREQMGFDRPQEP